MLKNAIVFGVGISGEAAAGLLVRQGWDVTVVDGAVVDAVRCDLLRSLGVRVLTSVAELPAENFDLCVVSPGIDQKSAWVLEMERREVEVISELELGFRYCKCPVIAVTGTNGKSTLVKLLYDIFMDAGISAAIAGNYGIPMCEVAERSAVLDWIVAEVSSFQLEKVSEFRPRVGVLLNIQPDHLDRHGSMQAYRELKSRLFRCMGEGDTGIVHLDEMSAIREFVSSGNRWVSFGTMSRSLKLADRDEGIPAPESDGGDGGDGRDRGAPTAEGLRRNFGDVYYDLNGTIACGQVFGQDARATERSDDGGDILRVDIAGSEFDNPILGQAAAAAVAVMQACGVSLNVVSERIKSFDSLSHRMQSVGVFDGVLFVNDSKATNLAALKAGLEMSNAPVRLIAGGRLKEKNLNFVKEVLANKAVCVYVIGSAANDFKSCWQDVVVCVHCTDLKTAVRRAWKDAKCGDTVLLSPGCSSFDQFKSYNDRGEQFKEIVEKINEEKRDENSVSG